MILNWQYGTLIITTAFDSCIKWELYTKTAFAIFSLFGALSSLIISAFLIIDTNWFISKGMTSFLYFNYLVFGPYMLGFATLGIIKWTNVAYVCDKQNFNHKNISPANIFSLVSCFTLSLSITVFVAIYKTMDIFIQSITSKPGGSVVIRKIFWWAVFRNREPVEFVRRAQQEGIFQNNTNVNQNIQVAAPELNNDRNNI